MEQSEFDEAMMRRALDLARNGAGRTSPNPMVGAVIVDADRRIVSEGWHEQYGGPHAEVNALRGVAGEDLSRATMYVSLEPCNHHGKTPPCSEAIIEAGIGRVVIAMKDPNPIVRGRGGKRLREAGIEVVEGVLEREAQRLNESYIHFIQTGTPFVLVKMAQTLDGFIALPDGESQWITGELARERVHHLRAAADAVLVGRNTAFHDNPSLTVRYGIEGRTPLRVVLDEHLSLPPTLNLFSDEHRERTHLFTSGSQLDSSRVVELQDAGVHVHGVSSDASGSLDLKEIVATLGGLGVASLLVEGGSTLVGSFVEEGLAQKIILFIAPKLFGHGIGGFTGPRVEHVDQAHRLDIQRVEMVGEDVMLTAYWHGG